MLQALAVASRLPDGLTFANPPLFKYFLVAEYAADYGLEKLLGITGSPHDFVAQFRANPAGLYLIARMTSAVLSAATGAVAGGLGAIVAGRRVGLIAAWLSAVAYLLVRDAHFGVDDALVTLLTTLGLVFCVRISRAGTGRDYAAGGALAGLAFAAKYDGIALLAPLVLAHVLRGAARKSGDLGRGGVACLVAAGVAFPSLLTEPGRVLHDVYLHLYLGARGGYDGLDPAGGYVFYGHSLVIGLGWPLVVAVLGGLWLAVIGRNRDLLVVAVLPVAMIGVLGAQQMYFVRFLLPTLPALIVLAAAALHRVIAVQPLVGLAALILVALPTVADAVRFDVLVTRADTRRQASDWIATHLPGGARVAVDAPPLGPPLSEPQQVLATNASSLFDLTLEEYRARGVAYVVASSFTSDVRPIDRGRDARRVAFYAQLARDAELVAQFRPYTGSSPPTFIYDQIYAPFGALDQLERPGPTVSVYRLNAAPGTPP